MLTKNAKIVLERRYLLRDPEGRVVESPDALFSRVAESVSKVEGKDKKAWARRFHALMSELKFLPNSPTLMNAGKKKGQLSACFVLPIEDDLPKIFDTLKNAALIHQSGGGTGFSFSRLRAKGSRVLSSGGTASGPVSFLKIFDQATETIKQGGTRRGANMAILNWDHPDIMEFVSIKRDLKLITNFNLSVGMTDAFFKGLKYGDRGASQLWEQILESAWLTGDPGLIFLDQINRFNPTPKLGRLESTNPCGEQPLLPYESCNLGSLDVSKFLKRSGGLRELDWSALGEAIEVSVRFLDDVITLNQYPIPECKKAALKTRKIGLGVMGFADLLLLMGIPYSSEKARDLGEKLMAFLDHEAKRVSRGLAKKRGAFPAFKGSLWDKLGYPKMRNATVSTVAPTGTISLIAGCSSGIEPIFSESYTRNVLSGEKLSEAHPAVAIALKDKGVKTSAELGDAFQVAHEIAPKAHIEMQARFQRHSDSAVSKTVNLPSSATRAQIEGCYLLAFRLGCKGITIYRDQSRDEQVLEARACEVCVD